MLEHWVENMAECCEAAGIQPPTVCSPTQEKPSSEDGGVSNVSGVVTKSDAGGGEEGSEPKTPGDASGSASFFEGLTETVSFMISSVHLKQVFLWYKSILYAKHSFS